MQEIELKFQIPAESLEAVRAELSRLAPEQALPAPLILQAAYFDTPDRKLAHARSALRVRREGDDWVQTLKAAGSHTMVRVEDNRPTQPPAPGMPLTPRLSLHTGGPAEAALRQSLGWDPALDADGAHCGLVQLYATDMVRTRVQVRVGMGTLHEGLVEVALDEGAILAGAGPAQRSVPVRELEIELISGHPQAVIDAGREWVQRFGLWLDTQTKAHRGDRLARLVVDGDATAALPEHAAPRPARLPKAAATASTSALSAEAAWRAGLEACLAHITAHMSELASLSDRHPEDVAAAPVAYQWRRGLRRLRALGRFVQDTAIHGLALPLPPQAHVALQSASGHAAVLARQLGHWRDQEALAWIPHKLHALGLPALPVPILPAPADLPASPVATARSTQATELCLQVLTALVSADALAADLDASARGTDNGASAAAQPAALSATTWLSDGLRRWHTQCARKARRFDELGPRATHRLRRRARQMRDVQDLFAPLWEQPQAAHAQHSHRALADHGHALTKALDALGQLQDETVALGRYRSVVAQDILAQAACAWLMARRKPLRKKAHRALRRWLRCKAPW